MPVSVKTKIKAYLTFEDEIKNTLTEFGLSEYELKIIQFICEQEDNEIITANSIIEGLHLDRGWVFKSLRNLESRKFINRSNGWIHLSMRHHIVMNRIQNSINKLFNTTNSDKETSFNTF